MSFTANKSHNESGVSFAVLKVFVLITRIMKQTVISVVKHAPLSLCFAGRVVLQTLAQSFAAAVAH